MPADLCKLEDMLTQEEKEKKEQTKAISNEQMFMETFNNHKSQEENTRVLEDAIQESLGATVAKCDELLQNGNFETQVKYVEKMLQPPTKAERVRYGTPEDSKGEPKAPSLLEFRDWLYSISRAFSQFMRDSNLVEACFGHCVQTKKKLNKTDAAAIFYLSTC